MAVTLLLSVFTGVVDWLFLPEGKQSGYQAFLGISKHIWVDVHLYSSLLFTLVLMIHLALNYRVYMSMARALFRSEVKS